MKEVSLSVICSCTSFRLSWNSSNKKKQKKRKKGKQKCQIWWQKGQNRFTDTLKSGAKVILTAKQVSLFLPWILWICNWYKNQLLKHGHERKVLECWSRNRENVRRSKVYGFLLFQVRRHPFNGKQTADGMAFVASQTLAQYSQPLHSMGQFKAE